MKFSITHTLSLPAIAVVIAAAGPSGLEIWAAGNVVSGGCDATHTNISNEKCRPDLSPCADLEYEKCHNTPELEKDIACVDNQLNNPCYLNPSLNCNAHKDADWDDCSE